MNEAKARGETDLLLDDFVNSLDADTRAAPARLLTATAERARTNSFYLSPLRGERERASSPSPLHFAARGG